MYFFINLKLYLSYQCCIYYECNLFNSYLFCTQKMYISKVREEFITIDILNKN